MLVGVFGSIVCIKLLLALSGVATQQALYILFSYIILFCTVN